MELTNLDMVRAELCGIVILPFMEMPGHDFEAVCLDAASQNLPYANSDGITQALTQLADALRWHRQRKAPSDVSACSKGDELLQLAQARTRLYRALNPKGPKAPYEAEWSNAATQDLLFELNATYGDLGLAATADRADYLGVELGFYQQLIQLGANASDAQERASDTWRPQQAAFLSDHLVPFAQSYVAYARTQESDPFLISHLLLFEQFVKGEKNLLENSDEQDA